MIVPSEVHSHSQAIVGDIQGIFVFVYIASLSSLYIVVEPPSTHSDMDLSSSDENLTQQS